MVGRSLSNSSDDGVDAKDGDEITAIAVMGVTGSGKSNFIHLATGSDGTEVGHNLASCTQETRSYEFVSKGRQFVLFDTPGFDDTYRGDADILADLAQTLSSLYKNKVKLAGIVYLHRIKDERMTNAIMRNLAMVRNLCGEAPLKNVILATTFWDELPDMSKGDMREAQLQERREWWGYMVSKGSKVRRFLNTKESAHEIMMELANKPRVTLQIQEEMVNQGLGILQTKAGEALNVELAEMASKHEEAIRQVKKDMEDAIRNRDFELQETLTMVQKEKEAQLALLMNEQEAMRADRREEMRRMEQQFNDQIHRLVADKKERDAQIDSLEARLTTERSDSDRRVQEALAASDENLKRLEQEMFHTRSEDREQYQIRIAEMQARREEADREHSRWKKEVEEANRQIRQMAVEQQGMGRKEKIQLEQRIKDLEAKKKKSSAKLWVKLGMGLLSVGTMGLAPLLGGGMGC